MLYIRGPHTVAHRKKLSMSHRKRLGIPDGHVIIYGFHIPFEHAEPLRYWAYWIANKQGRDEAVRFVEHQKKHNYPDIAQIREAWVAKKNIARIQEIIRDINRATDQNYRRPPSFPWRDPDRREGWYCRQSEGRVDL